MDKSSCDCCGKEELSIDLFWNVSWDEHTQRQLKVIDEMNKANYEAVCEVCFNKLVNKG